MAALTVATLALYGCMCIFWALPQNLLAGKAAAVGLGMVTMLGNVGGFVAPIIFGKLKDATGNFKLAFISVGLSLMLSVAGIIWSAAMARAQRRAANAIAG
jgi:nitrate/nitrite transporter NarK